MPEIIKITVDKLGRPKIEAIGFTGGACVTATKPILDALSDERNSKVLIEDKPEMYLPSQNDETEMELN
jgi:hypothetical protein